MLDILLDAGVPLSIVSAELADDRASRALSVYVHAVRGGDQHAARTFAEMLAVQGLPLGQG